MTTVLKRINLLILISFMAAAVAACANPVTPIGTLSKVERLQQLG